MNFKIIINENNIMLFIPGWLISILTFPGVIIHELGHVIFCLFSGVSIHEVCYFRFGNPAGYVIHDKPQNFIQSLLISVGPFIIGNLISIVFFIIYHLFSKDSIVQAIFLWLGFSTAFNCFPSKGDAKSLWKETNHHIVDNPLAILCYPIILLIYLANFLSFLWFDFFYSFFIYLLAEKLTQTYFL